MTRPTGGTTTIAAKPKNSNTNPKDFFPMKKETTITANTAKIKPNFQSLLVVDKVSNFSS